MENNFVPYELAFKLKELGFDEECLGFYTELGNLVIKENVMQQDCAIHKCVSPLWQQAFDWLFKEFNLWQYTFPNAHNKYWCYHIQWYKESFGWGESFIQNGFKTQEEARLECLKKLIEIAKEKCNTQ